MLEKVVNLFKNNKEQRSCIFCRSTPLTREHIYPKWSFELFGVLETSFNPATLLMLVNDSNNLSSVRYSQKISSQREIKYEDFAIKAVCKKCNEGWMSEVEVNVKRIFTNLLNGLSLEEINVTDSYQLSIWAIYKSILIAKTSQFKYDFDYNLLKILSQGIIPEGFIVEVTELPDKYLNYTVNTIEGLEPTVILKEEMIMAEENSFLCSLHFGNYGIRTTFFRSSISVQRYQTIERLLLLYPYHGKLPFIPGETIIEGELLAPHSQHSTMLGARIKLMDRYNFEPGSFEYIEKVTREK